VAFRRRTIRSEEDGVSPRRILPWNTSHSETVVKPVKSSPESSQVMPIDRT
jgi:hypothetical protein